MQVKRIIPILLGVVLFSMAASSVFADPLVVGGGVFVGQYYSVTTTSGSASAWVNGALVSRLADLQLEVQVTYAGPHNVAFRVVSGTFQIGGKSYVIDTGNWRGDYNRDTQTSTYQGPATAPDGRPAYFVILGQDTLQTSTGTYMHTLSDFRGEYGAVWHVNITTFRTRTI